MAYSYSVVYGDAEDLTQAGYGKVARLPIIFDSRPGYHRAGNQHLIDRGLGLWDPKHRGKQSLPIPPSASTMKSIAHRLAYFLEWCEIQGLNPLDIDYEHDLIRRYQAEMLNGLRPDNARALSPRTINSRIDAACDFQLWAADKGLRPVFSVPSNPYQIRTSKGTNPFSHIAKTVHSRMGKIRQPKRRIGLPSDEDIRKWLNGIYDKFGRTKGLMCELILQTAVRREEAACWRVDTLPLDKSNWKIVNRNSPYEHQAVLVNIKYGTKGKEYGRDFSGDKIGPEGIIRIPLPFADAIHEYRSTLRPKSLAKLVKTGRSISEQKMLQERSVHLFLDELSGKRITSQALYDAWRGVGRPDGWSPHLGRDYWACSLLLLRMREQKSLIEMALNSKSPDGAAYALHENVLSVIQLEIQPQLRHSSSETTLIYLQWLSDQMSLNFLYSNEIDS